MCWHIANRENRRRVPEPCPEWRLKGAVSKGMPARRAGLRGAPHHHIVDSVFTQNHLLFLVILLQIPLNRLPIRYACSLGERAVGFDQLVFDFRFLL